MPKIHIGFKDQENLPTNLPVQIDVLTPDLELLQTVWVNAGYGGEIDLEETGIFAVQAIFPSGKKQTLIAKTTADSETKLTFNLLPEIEIWQQSWAYMAQKRIAPFQKKLADPLFSGVWIRLWRKMNNRWEIAPIPNLGDASWEENGVSYSIYVGSEMHCIQVGGENIRSRFVALPLESSIQILISPAIGPEDAVYPLDITVSSNKWKAESLLTMLMQGNMSAADSMMSDASGDAEIFLMRKGGAPSTAAIGAYYLLRKGELPKLHSWPKNLAEWFPQMADGAIIYAWQLIRDPQLTGIDIHETVVDRLLEAADRGFPIYTEGLKLLHEGLRFHAKQSDYRKVEAAEANQKIAAFALAAEFSEPTVTFNGDHPSLPDLNSAKGIPNNMADLAFVFQIPEHLLEEMIAKEEAESKEITRGMDVDDPLAESVGVGEEIANPEPSRENMIRKLRMGKF